MPQWKLTTAGAGYQVTGEPVIVSDLAKSISSAIALLLIAVIVVMAGTLGLVFTGRPRLLPLALALLAAALTFGALSAAGASLTVASIAVLPVLVGLAVDYSIQFQSRVGESLEEGDGTRTPGGRRVPDGAPRSSGPPAPAGRRSPQPRQRARRRCSCCCSPRCRWCAASACCSWPASRSRCCARSPPEPRRFRCCRGGPE